MDTRKNKLMNKVLVTEGKGSFEEREFTTGKLTDNSILVKSLMTGICRSDIDMMLGYFGPLPIDMQGHEGLGRVIAVGNNVEDVQTGDFVATRGEPAYADMYIAKQYEYVRIPEVKPKYIIEPVACGINIIEQPFSELVKRSGKGKRLLLLGSGFLAWVAYHTILINQLDYIIDVVGSSNRDLWDSVSPLQNEPKGQYDVVIDLSSKSTLFTNDIVKSESLVIFGVQKSITTDFGNFLWKACTIIFPSPRSNTFYSAMQDAVFWIQTGKLNVDKFWTKGYNRQTEWKQAFEDGLNRSENYSRGYLYWDTNGN